MGRVGAVANQVARVRVGHGAAPRCGLGTIDGRRRWHWHEVPKECRFWLLMLRFLGCGASNRSSPFANYQWSCRALQRCAKAHRAYAQLLSKIELYGRDS